ncbi:inner membrane protein [Caldalkalibacillus uzonensis]|uniref:Inner membrane protein n=1 Tax=Caldalkalibacillus uzonensis TaxID=353224 RepID=A0ABU0CQU4_9BACI|nr:metal-dependent hydrolase [Caldalkalibacillus uzonensis]MDQ0337382.1 inner membrane protein [Caldalkalibacillus uzonensis]
MVASTHESFGLMWGLLTIMFMQSSGTLPFTDPLSYGFFLILVLIGSIFPDIDKFRSRLGRKLWFLSAFISVLFSHRGFTHSLLFIVIMGVSSLWVTQALDVHPVYALGWTLGVACHVAGDFMTKGGVALLYPYKKRFAFPLSIRTGSLTERGILFVLVMINLYLFLLLLTNIKLPVINLFVVP